MFDRKFSDCSVMSNASNPFSVNGYQQPFFQFNNSDFAHETQNFQKDVFVKNPITNQVQIIKKQNIELNEWGEINIANLVSSLLHKIDIFQNIEEFCFLYHDPVTLDFHELGQYTELKEFLINPSKLSAHPEIHIEVRSIKTPTNTSTATAASNKKQQNGNSKSQQSNSTATTSAGSRPSAKQQSQQMQKLQQQIQMDNDFLFGGEGDEYFECDFQFDSKEPKSFEQRKLEEKLREQQLIQDQLLEQQILQAEMQKQRGGSSQNQKSLALQKASPLSSESTCNSNNKLGSKASVFTGRINSSSTASSSSSQSGLASFGFQGHSAINPNTWISMEFDEEEDQQEKQIFDYLLKQQKLSKKISKDKHLLKNPDIKFAYQAVQKWKKMKKEGIAIQGKNGKKTVQKATIEEAAKILGVNPKTLEQFESEISQAQRMGVNIQENFNEKMSFLRKQIRINSTVRGRYQYCDIQSLIQNDNIFEEEKQKHFQQTVPSTVKKSKSKNLDDGEGEQEEDDENNSCASQKAAEENEICSIFDCDLDNLNDQEDQSSLFSSFKKDYEGECDDESDFPNHLQSIEEEDPDREKESQDMDTFTELIQNHDIIQENEIEESSFSKASKLEEKSEVTKQQKKKKDKGAEKQEKISQQQKSKKVKKQNKLAKTNPKKKSAKKQKQDKKQKDGKNQEEVEEEHEQEDLSQNNENDDDSQSQSSNSKSQPVSSSSSSSSSILVYKTRSGRKLAKKQVPNKKTQQAVKATGTSKIVTKSIKKDKKKQASSSKQSKGKKAKQGSTTAVKKASASKQKVTSATTVSSKKVQQLSNSNSISKKKSSTNSVHSVSSTSSGKPSGQQQQQEHQQQQSLQNSKKKLEENNDSCCSNSSKKMKDQEKVDHELAILLEKADSEMLGNDIFSGDDDDNDEVGVDDDDDDIDNLDDEELHELLNEEPSFDQTINTSEQDYNNNHLHHNHRHNTRSNNRHQLQTLVI